MTMCTGGELALILGGTALSYKANRDAVRRMQRESERAALQQLRRTEEAQQAIAGRTEEITPEARAERKQEIVEESLGSFQKALDDAVARGENVAGPEVSGALSDAFITGRARRTAENLRKASRMAELIARIRGAGGLRQEEAFDVADLAGRLGLIANFAGGEGVVAENRIAQAGNPDPLLSVIGQGLTAYGIGRAYSKAYTGKKTPSLTGKQYPVGKRGF